MKNLKIEMIYQIVSYLKFLYKSTNQHGVHSPFVYKLITECFYDKTEYLAYSNLKEYRQKLLKNNSSITVTDLGSGSRVLKNKNRKISRITKHVSTSSSRTKLLYRLVNYFQSDSILELGTSLGIATQALHLGNPKAIIRSIEGCPNISEISKKNLESAQVSNVELSIGDFKEVIQNLTSQKYDFIYFDGNHQKDATISYFDTLLQTVQNNTVFIFDDIYWSKGMTEAWQIIKKHPKVTVTIDTFFWGLVFFRKEQVKEHFTIRL